METAGRQTRDALILNPPIAKGKSGLPKTSTDLSPILSTRGYLYAGPQRLVSTWTSCRRRVILGLTYARGRVTIKYALIISKTNPTATTATRGPTCSKRWLSAVRSSTVARKTVTFT